jgi:hypothetical protein
MSDEVFKAWREAFEMERELLVDCDAEIERSLRALPTGPGAAPPAASAPRSRKPQ